MNNRNFEIKGLREVDEALKALPTKLAKNIVRTGIRRAMRHYNSVALRHFKRRSGVMEKSLLVKTRVERDGSVLGEGGFTAKGRRGKAVFYAKMVEKGTKPHIIKARKAKMLAIGYFSVKHPGSKPYRPMGRAFDSETSKAIRIATDYMRKRLKMAKALDIPDMERDDA